MRVAFCHCAPSGLLSLPVAGYCCSISIKQSDSQHDEEQDPATAAFKTDVSVFGMYSLYTVSLSDTCLTDKFK